MLGPKSESYKVEVLPPARDQEKWDKVPKGTVLSEESVGIVWELVFRDVRMLSRTALQRPWPVVLGLMQERVDLLVWFGTYKADQYNLKLHDEVARSMEAVLPQVSKNVLSRHRSRLRRSLDYRRSTLWPTLRTLLQRPSMHERVLQAARNQMAVHRQSGEPGGVLSLLSMPWRVLSLWVGFWRTGVYAMRWLLVELARRSMGWKQQRARTRLIEEALVHGVELQRRVESIEGVRPFAPRLLPGAPASGAPRFAAAAPPSEPPERRGWWRLSWPVRSWRGVSAY